MIKENNRSLSTSNARRTFIKSSAVGISSLIIGSSFTHSAMSREFSKKVPGTGELIKAYNIDYNWGSQNLSWFCKARLKDDFLFSFFEYTGKDYKADMEKMAADPVTQEWWEICKPCQEPLPTRAEGEW